MKTPIAILFLLISVCGYSQNLVFDGDSNTRGEFIESPGYWTGNANNYPNQIMQRISGYTGLNIGVNSSTSFEIVGNLNLRYPSLINSNTIYSLFIGINDFGLLKTAPEVFTNVKTIMAYVRSLGCTKIILSTYPPSDRVPVGGFQDLQRLEYNQMLRDSAAFFDFKLADVASTAEMNTYSTNYYADNIHWNINGCGIVAEKISEQINLINGITDQVKGTWLGSVSTDINNPLNWKGGLPTATENVYFKTGTNYTAEINSNLSCANFSIGGGANIIVKGTLKVSGSIIGMGKINADSGRIEFNGYSGQVLFAHSFQSNTIHNLAINNGAGVLLSGPLNITGALSPLFGIFTTKNNLTLKSTIHGTARVEKGPVGYNYVAGNVTVERYIGLPTAKRAWRLISTPLRSNSGTEVSIFDTWQLGGQTGAVGIGKGTLITGPSADANTNGLDLISGNSLKTFNGSSLVQINNTKTSPLFTTATSGANKSYFVFVRGDRSSNSLINTSSTTLSATGELQIGDQVFNTNPTPAGLALIGNPYASPVDLDLFRADNLGANIKPNYFIWDPQLNIHGGFITISYDGIGAGYTITPEGTSNTSVIQSGHAFFVETNNAGTGNTQVIFKETHKKDTVLNYGFRSGNQMEKFAINLKAMNPDSSTYLIDGAVAKYNNAYSLKIQDEDAKKMLNLDENFSMERGGNLLSVEGRPLIDQADTIYLHISNLIAGKPYLFQMIPTNLNTTNLSAFLIDNYLQTTLPISLHANSNSIIFNINSDSNSFSPNRFKIVFRENTTLPVQFIQLKATGLNNSINVQWQLAQEENINYYEVERSINGNDFIKFGLVKANESIGLTGKNNWIDNNPINGTNYYRIKVYNKNGEVNYSSIVSAKIGIENAGIKIYPNPVKGASINVLFSKQSNSIYKLKLVDCNGQLIYSGKYQHTGGTNLMNISLSQKLIPGSYLLELMSEKGMKTVLPVIAIN